MKSIWRACMLQVCGIIGGSPLPAPSGLYSPISNSFAPIATICRVTASLVLSASRLPRFIVKQIPLPVRPPLWATVTFTCERAECRQAGKSPEFSEHPYCVTLELRV
jgi:hypothetical protein